MEKIDFLRGKKCPLNSHVLQTAHVEAVTSVSGKNPSRIPDLHMKEAKNGSVLRMQTHDCQNLIVYVSRILHSQIQKLPYFLDLKTLYYTLTLGSVYIGNLPSLAQIFT